MAGFLELGIIAKDTCERSQSIIEATQGATAESEFIPDQLPPLDPASSPYFSTPEFQVNNLDAFTTARNVLSKNPEFQGKLAVLNLASDQYRAGGWLSTLCVTQVGVSMDDQILGSFICAGRSPLLLFHLVRNTEGGVLPMVPQSRRCILACCRHIQRRLGSSL